MNVIPLLVLLSLALATGGVLLFLYSVRQGDHEHATRLSLLPLEDDLVGTDAAPKSISTKAKSGERTPAPRGCAQ